MNIKKVFLGLISFGLALWSCTDDLIDAPGVISEGEETRISLKIYVPEIQLATRADMEAGKDTEINSLWVGIFNARTGENTYARYYSEADLSQIHNGAYQEHSPFYTLKDINTVSGLSYIVAVGNPLDASCYRFDSADQTAEQSRVVLISSDEGETSGILPKETSSDFMWDDYCSIAIRRLNSVRAIDTPVGNLLMSGIYTDDEKDPESSSDWETLSNTPVVIPATTSSYTMPGAIHLRRLISQIKFTIQAANKSVDDGRVVSVEPLSYQVYNVPAVSWLHERGMTPNSDSPLNVANAGDVIRINNANISYVDESLPHKANYYTSNIYNGQDITYQGTGNERVYSFDFWMLENKRDALGSVLEYNEREKERKIPDEKTDNDTKQRYTNTGLYTALVGEDGKETMNNCATYVEIKCLVTYTPEGIESLGSDSNIESRTAEATYVVHLGGVNGNWADFNSRRNYKYTYNITVVDVTKIIVEAKAENENVEDEQRPDVEGLVLDNINTKPIHLDAHYAAFNIALSDDDRIGDDEKGFTFRIEVYDLKGNRHIITEENVKDYLGGSNQMYYDWIEFRATKEGELASYIPHKDSPLWDETAAYARDERYQTFRLHEMGIRDEGGNLVFPHNDDGQENNGQKYYYTVFVNEYVYEPKLYGKSADERFDETANNWVYYVNLPERRAWLSLTSEISQDKESVYIRSKYDISQKSIQTFYDVQNIDVADMDIDAIGMEHKNESFGITLRWGGITGNYDMYNGRYNVWTYGLNMQGSNSYNWNDYVNLTSPQHIDAINKQWVEMEAQDNLYVPALQNRSYTDFFDDEPSRSQFIYAMQACFNRNRDNNGNGIIDPEEMRWYLPASAELIDMVIGRNSLETPLMDYNATPILKNASNRTNNPHWENTRFHYASSNQRVLWAEEGMSTSNFGTEYANTDATYEKRPWQVRCVRTLGTKLNIIDTEQITPAFEVDNKDAPTMIYPTYFEDRTLREPVLSGTISAHQETSPLNRIGYFGFEFKNATLDNQQYSFDEDLLKNIATHDAWTNTANANCVATYGTGWRLPNLKEISLIRLATEGKENAGPTNYASCTYREYGINDISSDGFAEYSRTDKTGYFFGVKDGANINLISDGNTSYYVRCVRDLREGEFPGK